MKQTYKSNKKVTGKGNNKSFKSKDSFHNEKKESPKYEVGIGYDYNQFISSHEEIEAFRKDHRGSSYTEIAGVRIDLYPEESKIFVVSTKNSLYLKFELTEKLIKNKYTIEKARIVGNKLFIFTSRPEFNEQKRIVIVRRAIVVNSIEFDSKNSVFREVATL